MRLILAGSREFSDYNLLEKLTDEFIDHYLLPGEFLEIVSGTALGADTFGEIYAKNNKIDLTFFEPDWELYGDDAPKIRNTEMAKYGTHAVLFWNGMSSGTRHMIDECKKYKLQYHVVNYENLIESVT